MHHRRPESQTVDLSTAVRGFEDGDFSGYYGDITVLLRVHSVEAIVNSLNLDNNVLQELSRHVAHTHVGAAENTLEVQGLQYSECISRSRPGKTTPFLSEQYPPQGLAADVVLPSNHRRATDLRYIGGAFAALSSSCRILDALTRRCEVLPFFCGLFKLSVVNTWLVLGSRVSSLMMLGIRNTGKVPPKWTSDHCNLKRYWGSCQTAHLDDGTQTLLSSCVPIARGLTLGRRQNHSAQPLRFGHIIVDTVDTLPRQALGHGS